MELQIGIFIIVALVGITLLLYSLRARKEDDISARIKTFITRPAQQKKLGVDKSYRIAQETSPETFTNRVFVPFFNSVINFLGRFTPSNAIENINHKLTLAGNPLNLKAREFFGIRLLLLLIAVALAYLTRNTYKGTIASIALASGFILTFWLLPVLWLRMLISRRQEEIRNALPDALDMLSICTYAGLGFDQAMQRISYEWDNALSEELNRVISEIELGVSRAKALKNMVARTHVEELTSFVAVILQAEKYGFNIAATLQSQAEHMRSIRYFRAKEKAQRLPAKMMFPLAFFILPALLTVLLGPVVLLWREIF